MNFEKLIGTQIYMAKWTLIYASRLMQPIYVKLYILLHRRSCLSVLKWISRWGKPDQDGKDGY